MSKSRRIGYFRLCVGGLKEDMAQRIMFSILPHLADPAQVALTEGVVDTKALRAAIEGRKNVIKYGVKSVLDELEHYNGGDDQKKIECQKLILSGNLEAAMDLAIDAFAEKYAWDNRFGGKAWEQIARTLRQIIRLDNQLSIIRSAPRSADNEQKEISVMRDLIVQLNVFDGLAHNSDDVIQSLHDFEAKDKQLSLKEKRQDYHDLKRLMDSKELESPIEVYKLISNTLSDSGDINKFKDWVSKIRQRGDYFTKDKNTGIKLFKISLRKDLVQARASMNKYRDDLSLQLSALTNLEYYDGARIDRILSSLENLTNEIFIIGEEFTENKDNFYKKYPEFSNSEIDTYIDNALQNAKKIHKQLSTIVFPLSTLDFENKEEDRKTLLHVGKQCLSIANKFSYFLDSL